MNEKKIEPNGAETSFHDEEPPPDPEDFTTKEEEERNRILMIHLKEQQTKAREFKKQIELEEKIKKELEKEQRDRELRANKEYLDRRNQSAKFRARENNERIEKLLNKVDSYMQRIKNLETIDQIKKRAEKEYEEEIAKKKKKKITKEDIENLAKLNNKNENLRNENLLKRKEREKAEEEKRKKLEKAKKANERAQRILKEGFQSSKPIEDENKKNKTNMNFGMFQIEEEVGGTNLSPDMMNNNNNVTNDTISVKNKKTSILPKISENSNEFAEMELRKILKNDPYNLKKLTAFKK